MSFSGGPLLSGLAGLGAQQELLEARGEGVALPRPEGLEEGLVGGDHRVQRLLGEALALRGEPDEHPAPVRRVRAAARGPGPLEAVEPRGHRARGDQRGAGEVPGVGPLVVAAPAKGVEDVDVAEAQPERLEGFDDGALEVAAVGAIVDADTDAAVRASVRDVEAAVLPHRAGHYPNFVEEPADASAFFDPETWRRLCEVKATYDPGDLFQGNHHIPTIRVRKASR